ncbi:restriction endonuclease [Rhizobium johnstonii]|uniref:restriction endonuclease n=1 Tax=Rhizobium johnstonii TaxID=3019933 RepID=UPI003F9BDE7F
MQTPPDDLERLFHEALEELAWKGDAQELADIVRRLNIGLPVEDEFMVVSNWLGKCEMIHKLDQLIVPGHAKQKYQVPDLIARFSTQSNPVPVLIEVKSKKSNTLSFQPQYLEKLRAYADLMSMPLLIAWKFHSVWIVFEPRHLKKVAKNYNIRFSDAMKENLLSALAGDFAFKVAQGAGVHLRFHKEKLIATIGNGAEIQETWQMRCVAVDFTGQGGVPLKTLSPEVQTLLTTWDFETVEEHTDHDIWVRNTAGPEGLRFGHSALVSLLDWGLPEGEKISWRQLLRKEKIGTLQDLRSATIKGLEEKVVHLILDQQPHSWPDFLRRPEPLRS